jgi:hypothetical protein
MRDRLVAIAVAVALSLVGASIGGASSSSGTPTQVAAALKKSITIRSIPADLTPSLSQVSNANAANTLSGLSWFNSCDPYANPAQVSHPVPCYFGDTKSTKTIVFVGDSNVGNWLPALANGLVTAKYRLAIFAYASCPTPDLTYTKADGGVQWSECNIWHTDVLKAIRAVHPVAVIAVSEAFNWGCCGITNTEWVAGFKKLFVQATLGSPSTLRILMGTSPQFGTPIPMCLASHPDPQSCDQSDRKSSTYGKFLTRDLQVAKASSAKSIPVQSWLCYRGTCSPIVGKYLVYVDLDHMSIAYSEFLSQVVTNAVVKLVKSH